MQKFLTSVALIVFSTTTYCQYNQSPVNNTPPDPYGGPANKMISEKKQTGSTMQVHEYHGTGDPGLSTNCMMVEYTLPSSRYHNQKSRDSLYDTRYAKISDAEDMGYERIRIYIRKEGFLGGFVKRTYKIEDLKKELNSKNHN